MNTNLFLTTLAVCAASLTSFLSQGDEIGSPAVVAKYTSEPVRLDGKLDEVAWGTAPAYSPQLPLKAYTNLPESVQKNIGNNVREKAAVRLLWDDSYLYVGATFEDSDAMNEGKEDQSPLCSTGDLPEVFLKTTQENYYWEIYGAPSNKKSWFFFPSRGRIVFPGCAGYLPAMFNIAAAVDGTLNNWKDKDKGWTVEIAIPIKELTAYGAKFDTSANWTILLARYNYSAFLQQTELSSCPQLSNANWHNYEEYAKLRLEK